jgi:hypothetical protein
VRGADGSIGSPGSYELDQLGSKDRAALIGMAANLPLTRIALQETQRLSWRLIWKEEIADRLRNAAKIDPPKLKT